MCVTPIVSVVGWWIFYSYSYHPIVLYHTLSPNASVLWYNRSRKSIGVGSL